MNSTKPQLRTSLQKARLELVPKERAEKSTTIAEKLLQTVDWSTTPKVHCFEPIMRLGEVDLVDFVTTLQTDRDNIQVYTSRKFGNEWLVVSTITDKPVDPVPKFDVIIVPMLGFDPKTLHRIGYGGGYYDRFLAKQPQTRKIGVCYEAGKVEHIPPESHDVPLDTIITESHTYTTGLT
jgi:5-formyltetrahydrofolate cyclo-ligase